MKHSFFSSEQYWQQPAFAADAAEAGYAAAVRDDGWGGEGEGCAGGAVARRTDSHGAYTPASGKNDSTDIFNLFDKNVTSGTHEMVLTGWGFEQYRSFDLTEAPKKEDIVGGPF